MNTELKRRMILGVANGLSWLWRILPERFRDTIVTGLFILESRATDPGMGLRRLFRLQDRLGWVINERAMAYGGGVHPKHRLTRYHDFFVDRIPAGSRVLDIGCGYGAVARSIATRVPGCVVVGVDMDMARLKQACASDTPANLTYIRADARCALPAGNWSVIVLSNILEHIDDRVGFLRDILRQANPELVLLRVPLFERDWTIPLRQELDITYFSDKTHFIEHRLDEFESEVTASGLHITEQHTRWGEIWAVCRCRDV